MEEIMGRELKNHMKSRNVIPIDVNHGEDYKSEHFEGSINIAYDDPDFVQKVKEEFINHDQEMVICGTPDLSKQIDKVAKKLRNSGYPNVKVYKASVDDWERAGLHVIKH